MIGIAVLSDALALQFFRVTLGRTNGLVGVVLVLTGELLIKQCLWHIRPRFTDVGYPVNFCIGRNIS